MGLCVYIWVFFCSLKNRARYDAYRGFLIKGEWFERNWKTQIPSSVLLRKIPQNFEIDAAVTFGKMFLRFQILKCAVCTLTIVTRKTSSNNSQVQCHAWIRKLSQSGFLRRQRGDNCQPGKSELLRPDAKSKKKDVSCERDPPSNTKQKGPQPAFHNQTSRASSCPWVRAESRFRTSFQRVSYQEFQT